MKKRIIAVFICVLFLATFFTTGAIAKNGGVVVSQSRITFEADKNSGPETVTLSNTSDEQMNVSIKVADFLLTPDNAFQILDAGSTETSAANLITCEETNFKMAGGEHRTFDVTLKKDNKYYFPETTCTILVKYIPTSVEEGKAMLKTYAQTAIVVRVLAGSMMTSEIDMSTPPLEVSKIIGSKIMQTGGDKNITFDLKNNGVITVEPKFKVQLKGKLTGEDTEIPMGIGFVQPKQERKYEAKLSPKAQLFDIYTVTFNYSYVYNNKTFTGEASYTFVVYSLPLLVGIIIVILGITIQIIIFKRRSKTLKKLVNQNEFENRATRDVDDILRNRKRPDDGEPEKENEVEEDKIK